MSQESVVPQGTGTHVVWDLGGNAYGLAATGTHLIVGQAGQATLVVTNGALTAGGPVFTLGSGTGGRGTMILTGSNTTYTVTNVGTSSPIVGDVRHAAVPPAVFIVPIPACPDLMVSCFLRISPRLYRNLCLRLPSPTSRD